MLVAAEYQQPKKQSFLQRALIACFGAFLIFLASQIIIPLEPVPITLQTLSIMIIGLTFERKAAFNAVMLYLTLGAVGFPMFTEFSGGFEHFTGPTGGYLLGFAMAVLLMGTFRTLFKADKFWLNVANCLLGSTVIYLFGISWLTRFVGFETAIQVGLMPFILPGVVKAGLLCVALRYIKTGRFSFRPQ